MSLRDTIAITHECTLSDPCTIFLTPDMNHRTSPVWLDSGSPPKSQQGQGEEEEGDDEEERRVDAGQRTKRERRQVSASATVCQVCNIQLNSSAQAQIHYKGKTHQRRLRRLAKAVSAGRSTFPQLNQLTVHYEPYASLRPKFESLQFLGQTENSEICDNSIHRDMAESHHGQWQSWSRAMICFLNYMWAFHVMTN